MVKGVLTLTLLPSKNSPYHNTDFDDTNETHPFRYPNGMSARIDGIANITKIFRCKNAHLLSKYFFLHNVQNVYCPTNPPCLWPAPIGYCYLRS